MSTLTCLPLSPPRPAPRRGSATSNMVDVGADDELLSLADLAAELPTGFTDGPVHVSLDEGAPVELTDDLLGDLDIGALPESVLDEIAALMRQPAPAPRRPRRGPRRTPGDRLGPSGPKPTKQRKSLSPRRRKRLRNMR